MPHDEYLMHYLAGALDAKLAIGLTNTHRKYAPLRCTVYLDDYDLAKTLIRTVGGGAVNRHMPATYVYYKVVFTKNEENRTLITMFAPYTRSKVALYDAAIEYMDAYDATIADARLLKKHGGGTAALQAEHEEMVLALRARGEALKQLVAGSTVAPVADEPAEEVVNDGYRAYSWRV